MLQDLRDFILLSKEEYISSESSIEYEKLMQEALAKYDLNSEAAEVMDISDIYFYLMIADKPEAISLIKALIAKYQEYFNNPRKREILRLIFLYYNDDEFTNILEYSLHVTNSNMADKAHGLIINYMEKQNISLVSLSKFTVLLDTNFKMVRDFQIAQGIGEKSVNIAFRYAEYATSIKGKTSKNIIKKTIWKLGNSEKVFDDAAQNSFIEILHEKFKKYQNNVLKAKRAMEKRNSKLDRLIELLSVKGEISRIDAILELCPNEEIKERVVDYILKHNLECYQEINTRYQNLKNNDVEAFKALLKGYGFSFQKLNREEQQSLIIAGYERISECLDFFYKNEIHMDIRNIAKIDFNKLEKIKELLGKGFINKDFINSHNEILFGNNDFLDIIIQNVTFLNSQKINMINYSNSLDILLSTRIMYNLNLLLAYGLEIGRKTLAINFLQDDNLEAKIELGIEMGLLHEEELDILNKPFEELYQDKIYRLLDINRKVEGVFNYQSFFIDSALEIISDEYKIMFQASSLKETPLPFSLQKYQINRQVLLINGVYVSIKRLCDNLSKILVVDEKALFYAIIYGSYYTMMEIEALSTELYPEFLRSHNALQRI